MTHLVARVFRWFFPLCCVLGTAGCGCAVTDYMAHAVAGELNLIASSVPIEQALGDPTLSDEQRSKLALVISARDYARDVIGLNVGDSYRRFVNLHGEPLAWNLSASPKDAIEPYVWNLPIVGSLPYLGFFKLDRAVAVRDRLVAEGYDTLIYELDAYSTLGLLPDPVTSSLLERPVYSLVDTLFHELLHNTIWNGADVVYDESLAVFVGRTGALEFLADQFGPDDPVLQEARDAYEDADRFNDFLSELRDQLEELYASDRSRDEKIEARRPIFEAARTRLAEEVLPQMHNPDAYRTYTETTLNNAFLLVYIRYNTNGELFEAVYEKAGRNWPTALAVFAQAAADPAPFDALRAYLDR